MRSPIINVMVQAAEKATPKLIRDFGEVENLQVSRKGPADFVSIAQKNAEDTLQEELLSARPSYGFLMGRKDFVEGTDYARRFIIDPLCGTKNFSHGIPHFAISVAYEEHKKIVAGIIYDPIKNELFWVEQGQGAFLNDGRLNDRRLRVSQRRNLPESLFATGVPSFGVQEGDGHLHYLRRLQQVIAVTAGVRSSGAPCLDLAYVAAGRFEGYWERGLRPWDVAAGFLLVKEAGGFASDSKGRGYELESEDIVVANTHIHSHFLDLLRLADKRSKEVKAS